MSALQRELVTFSRVLALLFNRATMYHSSHPYVQRTIDDFHSGIVHILMSISPLVFLMNRDQFFIDKEPLHAGANVSRIVTHFNKAGIQSVSFDSGLEKSELRTFLDVFTSLDDYPSADEMKKALAARGVKHIKINRVIFKKVTEDDEVVAREALKDLTPKITNEDELKSKKFFIDIMLEHLLGEELRELLTMENLLRDPAALSKKMTEIDLAGVNRGEVEGTRPGLVLMHQLEMLGEELEKNLLENKNANLPEIAGALVEMKKRLLQGIEAEKSLNIQYSNEEMILDKVNEITDNVVLRIVRDEYKTGKTSPARLAQIVRRLVPEAAELKRLLPKIRSALIGEGMALTEYLHLVREIGKELQSEELANILQESSEEIGVDGEMLIEEIKKNPVQAAELIYLAAEVRKGSGDDQALSDLLVGYVERLGSKLTTDVGKNSKEESQQHLRQVLTSIESGIVGRLKGMDFKSDLLERLEKRFNDQIDGILEKAKLDWIHSHTGSGQDDRKELSVLELLEQTVADGDELGEILDIIRRKVEANEIDKDNFAQIYAEITKEQASRALAMKERMPKGVLEAPVLNLLIEKEITRAKRYNLPFSAISFSLVKAVPKSAVPSGKISYHRFMAATFQAISKVVRDADIIGELGKNRIVVLLPMTSGSNAKLALNRCLKQLHASPLNVDGTPLEIKLAGVAVSYDFIRTPDAGSFVQTLTDELAQMERRIKNLQIYF
jgi:hypothetical protein